MQLIEALIEIGKRNSETWAVRAERAQIAYRDTGIGQAAYEAVIDETPAGSPGHTRATLLHHSLPCTLAWLVEHGKHDLLHSDAWQCVDAEYPAFMG